MSSTGSGLPMDSIPTTDLGDFAAQGQTLHQFVLGLLGDDAARTAFAADPTGVLANAGLGAVDVHDVRDAIPFVADYAPSADAVTDLRAIATQLTSGTDLTGGVNPAAGSGHLDTTAEWFTGTNSADVDTSGLHATAAGATDDLGYATDLTTDGQSLTAAALLQSDEVNGAGYIDVAAHRVATAFDSDFGSFASATTADGTTAAGSVAGFDTAVSVEHDVSFLSTGATDPTALLDAHAVPEVDIAVAGAGTLSTAGLVSHAGLPHLDPTGVLDADALRGADLTAGTVADYVHSGGELLGTSTAGLGGFLTGGSPVHQVEEVGEHLRGTLPQPLPSPEHHAPVGHGDLPHLPAQLPVDLPHLPGGLPQLPTDLPDHLPVHLPTQLPHLPELSHLPVQLPEVPHLPVANPLPGVADHVSDTLGGLTHDTPLGGEHAALPDVGGLVGDLDLGH
ncbi:IniB N-terminal domain-containing protein [Actinokineospora inagensis]|uniref:IniB N-terminal domain-containing protein n=1 Tax=Actinokineospora inagensis TaxID=103730 RepID=UPI0004053619|nr:IniB N-terminal domain-containing protein [Actinokineospora inagensis]